jgi:uncharacterized protein (TIGR03067 family)
MRTISLIALLLLFAAQPAIAQVAKPQTVANEPVSGEQIDKMLKEMGLKPQLLSPGVWQTTIDHDGWKVHVLVSLLKEGRIGLECKFSSIPDPEIVPSSSWLKLLEENERITPAHFSFDKSDKRVHLYKTFDNIAVTSTRLKQELDSFDVTVRRTQSVWRNENFAPAEALPIPPRETDKKTSGLDGVWRLVRIETRGQSTTEQHLAANRGVTIAGDKVTLNTGLEPERTAAMKVDPNQKPKAIDFISANDRVEKGIYLEETGLLMICVAGAGEDRPRKFATDPKNRLWLLVLKRDK